MSYSYDNTNQLTADGSASYSFDANGNRTMAGYATSTGNRTTNDGTWTYTFDDAGNEIKKSQGAGAETWNYLYDARNQLIAAEQHALGEGALASSVTRARTRKYEMTLFIPLFIRDVENKG